jgi:hypothetical protein
MTLLDAADRHTGETSVCSNGKIDSGQDHEESLVVRGFQAGIAVAFRGRPQVLVLSN